MKIIVQQYNTTVGNQQWHHILSYGVVHVRSHVQSCFFLFPPNSFGVCLFIVSKFSDLFSHSRCLPVYLMIFFPHFVFSHSAFVFALSNPTHFTSAFSFARTFSCPNSSVSVGPGDHSSAQKGVIHSQTQCFVDPFNATTSLAFKELYI